MKILIGIPTIREDKNFWESMRKFLPEMSNEHDIEIVEVKNKMVDDARNIIVDKFLESDKDYLLFLDDDHSNHTVDMVNALFIPKTEVCAMKCYSRSFPHLCTLMSYSGLSYARGRYQSMELNEGYKECALVGFGMTLIKKSIFSKLKKPYFIKANNLNEDNYFCENMIELGIYPIGCFDYVCTHNGVDDNNLPKLRDRGIIAIVEDIKKRVPSYTGERLIISA